MTNSAANSTKKNEIKRITNVFHDIFFKEKSNDKQPTNKRLITYIVNV